MVAEILRRSRMNQKSEIKNQKSEIPLYLNPTLNEWLNLALRWIHGFSLLVFKVFKAVRALSLSNTSAIAPVQARRRSHLERARPAIPPIEALPRDGE